MSKSESKSIPPPPPLSPPFSLSPLLSLSNGGVGSGACGVFGCGFPTYYSRGAATGGHEGCMEGIPLSLTHSLPSCHLSHSLPVCGYMYNSLSCSVSVWHGRSCELCIHVCTPVGPVLYYLFVYITIYNYDFILEHGAAGSRWGDQECGRG